MYVYVYIYVYIYIYVCIIYISPYASSIIKCHRMSYSLNVYIILYSNELGKGAANLFRYIDSYRFFRPSPVECFAFIALCICPLFVVILLPIVQHLTSTSSSFRRPCSVRPTVHDYANHATTPLTPVPRL